MPWEIREESDGRYCVYKEDGAEALQCYDERDDAEAYLRALYASEHGQSVKALGDGRIGGYGVVWGSAQQRDLAGDYFTPESELWADQFPAVPVLYDHGQGQSPGVVGKTVRYVRDHVGVWVEAQLDRANQYWKAVEELIDKGALAWSSGSVAHLVERERGWLKRWPIVEMSLTPTPAEPRLTTVQAVKANYQAAGLLFEIPGGAMSEQENVGLDESRVQAMIDAAIGGIKPQEQTVDEGQIKSIIDAHLAPYLVGQPRGGNASNATSADDAMKTFDGFLHGGIKNPAIKAAMQENVDAEGGYYVPEQAMTEVIAGLRERSLIRAAGARVFQVNGDRVTIPGLTWSSAAVITGEEAAYSEVEPTASQIVFTPYKFSRLARVSEELAADAMFDIWGQILAPDFTQAFVYAENSYFTTGTGAGQPQGVVTGGTVGTTTAAAAAITADEIVDTYHALNYLYRMNAVWMMHDTTAKYIRKLLDGTGQYLWQPGLQAGQPDRILGRPVITNNNMAEIAASAKTILFGDFSYYGIAMRGGWSVDRNPYLYMANGQVGFFARQRMDGRVLLAEAFTVLQQHS